WRRVTPAGLALLAAYFLYFCLIFPFKLFNLDTRQKLWLLFPGFAFAFLSIATGWLVRGITVRGELYLAQPIYAWGYIFYAIYLVLYFLAATSALYYKYAKSTARVKLQLFYSLLGTVISIVLVLAASLVLPLFGRPEMFSLAPPFTLIMALLITYAIVRHNLLRIEGLTTLGVIFLALAAALVATIGSLWSGQFWLLPLLYVVIANVCLGLFLVVSAPRNEVNLSFSVSIFSVAFWAFSLYMLNASPDKLLWERMAFLGPLVLAPSFIYFSWVFPRRNFQIKLWHLGGLLFPAVVMLALASTDLIVKEVSLQGTTLVPIRGFGYTLFLVVFVAYMAYALQELVRKYLQAVGGQKVQLGYVFFGVFLSVSAVALTNLLLPFFGNVSFTTLGPFFTLFYIVFVSYAVIKHRLMSIEVVIQRGTVYAFATVLIMALYALAVMISEVYLRQIIGYTSLAVTALAALVIAVAYQPLVTLFQLLADRIFFRGRYDYQKILRQISHDIASVIKLEELSRLIVVSFVETMRVAEISFLLPDKDHEHFRSVSLNLPHYKRMEIDLRNPIISRLALKGDILVRDEVEDEISREDNSALVPVRDAMDRLGITVWVPIIAKDELSGIIALGDKLSGDLFTAEDLALLTTLANQTAVALDNARLYNEVLTMKNYSEEILQSMTNGVLTTDNTGRVVTYNQMAESITGRKWDDVIGRTCEEVWGKMGAIPRAIESTLRGAPLMNFETGLSSPVRGLVPVAFSSTLLRDSQGKKNGALLSIQDLSEMKELEGKIRRADKLTALATMAAGMAHEIKNPLSSMKVFAQLLPQKIDDPEYRQKLGEIMPREIDRIDRIVESLLSFARATEPTFVRAKVEEILDYNLNYYTDKAQGAGVKIRREYTELPEIELDKSQISQLFSNLILNGIQAMPEGGELTVKTFPGKMVDDLLQSVKVQVSDTGHGIPEEMQKKLFDPFFTTKYGGTGLGLTISHSIVDGHKG
ncbi:MAG: ATP-binding protein, partial [Candidatus Margulisiibacteriota bacterium]